MGIGITGYSKGAAAVAEAEDMTVREAVELLSLQVCAGAGGLEAEVSEGIACDLLSVVLSHAPRGALWITVQCHPNVVAVAQMVGLAGIVIAHGFEPEEETRARAEAEGLPVLTTTESTFAVAGALAARGVR